MPDIDKDNTHVEELVKELTIDEALEEVREIKEDIEADVNVGDILEKLRRLNLR